MISAAGTPRINLINVRQVCDMFSVLILAAGSSSRMGGGNKQLALLAGEPVLRRSVQAFLGLPEAAEVVVVCRPQDEAAYSAALVGLTGYRLLPVGGQTRQQSVAGALPYLSPETRYLAIHDGARPLVRRADILAVFHAAQETGSALLGVFARDTIKIVQDGRVASTPARSSLFIAQTPQAFKKSDYLAAMAEAKAQGLDFTDDAQLFELTGRPVTVVEGRPDNLKITTPEDLRLAEGSLAGQEVF